LYENFPNFNQNFTRIAAYGESTAQAVLDKNLQLDVRVPDPNNPHLSSMAEAIDHYIKEVRESKE
jgi:uroporphyrinogen-III synthase